MIKNSIRKIEYRDGQLHFYGFKCDWNNPAPWPVEILTGLAEQMMLFIEKEGRQGVVDPYLHWDKDFTEDLENMERYEFTNDEE